MIGLTQSHFYLRLETYSGCLIELAAVTLNLDKLNRHLVVNQIAPVWMRNSLTSMRMVVNKWMHLFSMHSPDGSRECWRRHHSSMRSCVSFLSLSLCISIDWYITSWSRFSNCFVLLTFLFREFEIFTILECACLSVVLQFLILTIESLFLLCK